ncbi:hypothetical protein LEP1GSC073_0071 [Leptospira noguchii str. Cascata]|nr:hypothetical protein LEP1GSC073_0071 [Leptospira noguchii str. Cascata]
MKIKYKFRFHSILGIVSILLLSCKLFLLIFNFSNSLLSQDLSLVLGKIGIVLGLLAFFTGCGLGKYSYVQNCPRALPEARMCTKSLTEYQTFRTI